MKTLSAQFDEMIIFGGVVGFFYEILGFLHKIKYFQYIAQYFHIVNITLTMSLLCLYVL